MKYTLKDLRVDFPDEDACLEWLVNWLYPDGVTCKKCERVTKHYKDKGRRSYSCGECGLHMHPTAGTICHNSHIPLTDWFYVIYLMSTNKAGTSATQIQRELGCTYKTAWRMMHQIRKMMEADEEPFIGEVEVDETFLHGNVYKRSSAQQRYGPTGARKGEIVVGLVERSSGRVKAWHVKSLRGHILVDMVRVHVARGQTVYTDSHKGYVNLRWDYKHHATYHGRNEHVSKTDPSNHTQNIENFWSTWKPRMKGTYKSVSKQHLQLYANEYAWRYSHRHDVSMFWSLMGRIDNR